MKLKLVLAVAAVLLIPAMVIGVLVSKSNAAPTRSGVAHDRIILVAGTGILVENGSRYRLCTHLAGLECTVDFGTVDDQTVLHNRAMGFGPDSAVPGDAFRHFVGKRITVIAEVEASIHSEQVFAPVHARHVTFLTGTHVVQ